MKKKILHKAKGLSDKAVAWIFITPTLLLLLAINIYPLIYAISMSFTNFYANKLGKEIKWVGLKNYAKINGITDERWQLLTSDLSNIRSLKREGFMLFADELPQGHAIKFVLIDQDGNIRKYFDGTDEASLAVLRKDITNLVKDLTNV